MKNEDYEFVEVIGFDDDLLAFVPQPVSAVLLIFPITEQVPLTDPCLSIDERFSSTKNIDRKNWKKPLTRHLIILRRFTFSSRQLAMLVDPLR